MIRRDIKKVSLTCCWRMAEIPICFFFGSLGFSHCFFSVLFFSFFVKVLFRKVIEFWALHVQIQHLGMLNTNTCILWSYNSFNRKGYKVLNLKRSTVSSAFTSTKSPVRLYLMIQGAEKTNSLLRAWDTGPYWRSRYLLFCPGHTLYTL